jgi:hypothetical protein
MGNEMEIDIDRGNGVPYIFSVLGVYDLNGTIPDFSIIRIYFNSK